MRAQHTFGLNLSWLRVTTVFLIGVGTLWLAGHWPVQLGPPERAWWPAVGLVAASSTAALVTHRRVPLTTIFLARVFDRFADPGGFLTEGCTTGLDHLRRYGRDPVGVREYRGRLVSVIALAEGHESTGRHQHAPAPATAVPAELVAKGLRQFDIRLDGIDVVSVRTSPSPADEEADEANGDTAAPPAPQQNWVILRMDPMSNTDAVAVRDSVAGTLAAATERLAHDLAEHRLHVRVLPADEFDRVDAAVLAGLQPDRIRRKRRRLKQKQRKGRKHFAATFWMSPRDITSENLPRLWLPETDTTAVTVRLSARAKRIEVAVLVRYHSASRLRRSTWAGLNRLNGRQLTALRTSLPAPMRRTLAVPARKLDDRESLQVPLGSVAPQPQSQPQPQPQSQPPARVRVPA